MNTQLAMMIASVFVFLLRAESQAGFWITRRFGSHSIGGSSVVNLPVVATLKLMKASIALEVPLLCYLAALHLRNQLRET